MMLSSEEKGSSPPLEQSPVPSSPNRSSTPKRRKSVSRLLSSLKSSKSRESLTSLKQDFVPDLAVLKCSVSSKGKDVINRRYSDGKTPLHLSVELGKLDIIEYLHSLHCKLDPVDSHGWTPLHMACQEGKMNVIMFLIAAGANCTLLTDEYEAPVHIFIRNAAVVSLILGKYIW